MNNMTPYRHETQYHHVQSVGFYKFIAITFLCITVVLLGVILFMSSKRATITVETKPAPVDVTGAVSVSPAGGPGMLNGLATSTIVFLSDVYAPENTIEVTSTAGGIVLLHNDTAQPVSLVARTRVLSQDGILFRLKQRADIPPQGTVSAEVAADAVESVSTVGPGRFTIPGLLGARQKVIYATTDAPLGGGTTRVGVLTAEDRNKAEKQMAEKLLAEAKRRFSGYPGNRSGAYAVADQSIEIGAAAGATVDRVPVTGSATVVAVLYEGDELRKQALSMLMKRAVGDTELIEPSSNDPTVAIEEYDVAKGTARLKVFFDGVVSLNPESKELTKTLFFGKSRDEVRRYLLSLDHVHGVDVKFSPAWMMSVPHMGDHVEVVVKKIE